MLQSTDTTSLACRGRAGGVTREPGAKPFSEGPAAVAADEGPAAG